MIIKSYELDKLNINKNKYLLFYGLNEGAKKEAYTKLFSDKKGCKILKYEEKQILDNPEIFFDEVSSKSLFENQKSIIINRATDKLASIFEKILKIEIDDIILILSGALEKKSKLRNLFEKKKELICVPFYADNFENLLKIAITFFQSKKINISQSNINLLINRCGGDREILKNELEKIEIFALNKKKVTESDLFKLSNLIEDYSISELVDSCLSKNGKKTIHILNENNFATDECMLITRTFVNKLKRNLKLSKDYKVTRDINKTIINAKPPIFWKDKEVVKNQIMKWTPDQIIKLLSEVNDIEYEIKKNNSISLKIISNFILDKAF